MGKTDTAVGLESLSDDDLMSEWTALGEEVEAGKARLREFSQEHQRRVRKQQLARMAKLSEDDLALLQEIKAEGVESDEAVQTGEDEG